MMKLAIHARLTPSPCRFTGECDPKPPQMQEVVSSPPEPAKKKPKRRRAFKLVSRGLIGFMALFGTMEAANHLAGDGRVPWLMPLHVMAPDLKAAVLANTGAELFQKETVSLEEGWQALQPTMKLVRAISPEISGWLKQYHQEKRIHFNDPSVPVPEEFASWSRFTALSRGELRLGRRFWQYTDGEKASILAHAYRHHQQNAVKNLRQVVFDQPVRLVHWIESWGPQDIFSAGSGNYGNRLEDEAYLFHRDALDALGITEAPMGSLRWNVEEYLRYRGLHNKVGDDKAAYIKTLEP